MRRLACVIDVAYRNFSMQTSTEAKHSVRFKLPNHLVARAILIYKNRDTGRSPNFRMSRQRDSMTRYGGCDESASNEQRAFPVNPPKEIELNGTNDGK